MTVQPNLGVWSPRYKTINPLLQSKKEEIQIFPKYIEYNFTAQYALQMEDNSSEEDTLGEMKGEGKRKQGEVRNR